MSLEEDVRKAIQNYRAAADKLIEVPRTEDDTVTLGLMISGLSNGIEDALALIARRLDEGAH